MTIDAPEEAIHQITLSRDGVVAPASAAARDAAEAVQFALRALADADLSEAPVVQGTLIGVTFEKVAQDPEDRRQAYASWLLCRGFQELLRGIRASFEEALIYLDIYRQRETLERWGDFQAALQAVKSRAERLNFPDLMTAVSDGLAEPLAFQEEIRSLQRVRNCLEHRRGVVGQPDIDTGSAVLTARFPHFQILVRGDGEPRPIQLGMHISAGEVFEISRAIREISYHLGDKIAFSAEEFTDIAFAINVFFSNDLGPKLPA